MEAPWGWSLRWEAAVTTWLEGRRTSCSVDGSGFQRCYLVSDGGIAVPAFRISLNHAHWFFRVRNLHMIVSTQRRVVRHDIAVEGVGTELSPEVYTLVH